MPVVGVLVEAEIGHHDEVVADIVAEVAQGDLHDAVLRPRLRSLGVLNLRNAEQDHAGHAELDQPPRFGAHALAAVLCDTG